MNKIRNNIGTGLRIGYTFTQTAHVINIYMNKETDRRQTGRQRDKEKRRCSSVAHRSLRFYWERDTASPKWRHTKKYNKQQRPKKKKKKLLSCGRCTSTFLGTWFRFTWSWQGSEYLLSQPNAASRSCSDVTVWQTVNDSHLTSVK